MISKFESVKASSFQDIISYLSTFGKDKSCLMQDEPEGCNSF